MCSELAALFPFTALKRRAMTLADCVCVLQFTLVLEVRRFQRRFCRLTL